MSAHQCAGFAPEVGPEYRDGSVVSYECKCGKRYSGTVRRVIGETGGVRISVKWEVQP